MNFRKLLAAAAVLAGFGSVTTAAAEPLIYGIQIEQAEYRVGSPTDVFAWDFDALIGTDELKFVWRSEGEYAFTSDRYESLENQFRLQKPISEFFDVVAGPQAGHTEQERSFARRSSSWSCRAVYRGRRDLFIGEHPSIRLEAEYEMLVTNRFIVTPSIEFDLPLNDDAKFDQGAFAPTLEVGLRAGYDLIDRAFSPYIGVHYERSFGKTANIKRSEGEDAGSLFFVAGARMLF